MPKAVISVEKLSKAYRIGMKDEIPDTLMAAMQNYICSPWKNFKAIRRLNTAIDKPVTGPQDPQTQPNEIFWALRDVSFKISQGDVVGIIGRNGAGKSTLLKVLSRITEPTSGRVVIRGRVSSLLEVGTGFHPELTGRENVYMNGTLLGMRKKEIDRKFDEIVDFSGVETFLDTPTKRYSSGMQVRLAFAVAAHLEPEILVIDEVLAVGDAQFQKKCISKIKDVATGGRTVLFVSHDLAAIESLCSLAIYVSSGKTSAPSPVAVALEKYAITSQCVIASTQTLDGHPNRTHDSKPVMNEVSLHVNGTINSRLKMGDSLAVEVKFSEVTPPVFPVLGVVIKSSKGQSIMGVNNRFINGSTYNCKSSSGSIVCDLGDVRLVPGIYKIDLYFGDEYRDIDIVTDAIDFEIESTDFYGTGKTAPSGAGPVRGFAVWHLK